MDERILGISEDEIISESYWNYLLVVAEAEREFEGLQYNEEIENTQGSTIEDEKEETSCM